jgi:hypothetical protein
VFTARYALSPYIEQVRFVFKGLNYDTSSAFTYDRKKDRTYVRNSRTLDRLDLHFSVLLHSVECESFTDVSGQRIGPILKGQEVKEWDRNTFPKRRYRITIRRCVTPQKNADLINIAAEAWNHELHRIFSYRKILKSCPVTFICGEKRMRLIFHTPEISCFSPGAVLKINYTETL